MKNRLAAIAAAFLVSMGGAVAVAPAASAATTLQQVSVYAGINYGEGGLVALSVPSDCNATGLTWSFPVGGNVYSRASSAFVHATTPTNIRHCNEFGVVNKNGLTLWNCVTKSKGVPQFLPLATYNDNAKQFRLRYNATHCALFA